MGKRGLVTMREGGKKIAQNRGMSFIDDTMLHNQCQFSDNKKLAVGLKTRLSPISNNLR